jgi:hypothetical protein
MGARPAVRFADRERNWAQHSVRTEHGGLGGTVRGVDIDTGSRQADAVAVLLVFVVVAQRLAPDNLVVAAEFGWQSWQIAR